MTLTAAPGRAAAASTGSRPGFVRAKGAGMAPAVTSGPAGTGQDLSGAGLPDLAGLERVHHASYPGVPEAVTADTLLCEYNDLDAARALAEQHAADLACVIVEPVAGNMGVIAPRPGFLEGLRAICNGTGALLILDEVITGFRVAYGGAQERLAVRPDLTCLGKIVGGGLPAAAFGGRGDVMERLAPLGDVYQAGTLAGNPLAMAAGSATLELLRADGAYEQLEQVSEALGDGLASTGVTVNRLGAMLTGFFHPGPVENFAEAARSDTGRYAAFHAHMLDRGVYLAPSQCEAMMPSLAHTSEQVEQTLAAAREFAG